MCVSQFVCVCLVGAVPLGDSEKGLMMSYDVL